MGFTAAINLLAATATLTHATGRDEAAPDAAARMRADSARPLRLAESPGKGAPGTVVIPPKLPGGLKGPPDIVNPNKDKGPGLLDLSKEKPKLTRQPGNIDPGGSKTPDDAPRTSSHKNTGKGQAGAKLHSAKNSELTGERPSRLPQDSAEDQLKSKYGARDPQQERDAKKKEMMNDKNPMRETRKLRHSSRMSATDEAPSGTDGKNSKYSSGQTVRIHDKNESVIKRGKTGLTPEEEAKAKKAENLEHLDGKGATSVAPDGTSIEIEYGKSRPSGGSGGSGGSSGSGGSGGSGGKK